MVSTPALHRAFTLVVNAADVSTGCLSSMLRAFAKSTWAGFARALELINVCHTTMVALDQQTMSPRRPFEGVAPAVPPLALEAHPKAGTVATEATAANARQEERAALSQWHQAIRKHRHRSTMEIRQPLSTPPTADEMASLHQMHRSSILAQEQPRSTRPPPPRTVQRFTFRSSFAVFPEKRNVHGKLFGGFVAGQVGAV